MYSIDNIEKRASIIRWMGIKNAHLRAFSKDITLQFRALFSYYSDNFKPYFLNTSDYVFRMLVQNFCAQLAHTEYVDDVLVWRRSDCIMNTWAVVCFHGLD